MKKTTFTTFIASLMVVLTAFPVFALDPGALPTGGRITSGSGSITQSGSAMTVNQQTARMVADWSTFNIGQNASVAFNQPSSSAVALNRIFDQNPSQIFGSLKANGQIFLINPQGIYFGPGATVDVGGLVASTLYISNASFLSGNYTFTGKGTGSIVNQGTINAAGYGYVAFISPVISNQGTITATNGTVAMAAGNKVSLDFTGDKLVSFTVDKGAVDALIENKGLVQADGGMVMMTAKAASMLTDAVINNSGTIEARTLENVSGRIVLISDKESGQTIVGGTLDASAPNGGDGGSIETSAAKVTIKDDARITTAAPYGKTGSWLIDPNDFTVASGGGGDVTGATLTSALLSNDVTIQTTSGSASCTGATCGSGTSGNGDIFVNDSVTWSSHTLTLNAYRNITIGSPLYGSGTAGLSLLYGQGAADGVIGGATSTYTVSAPVNLASTGSFSTQLGSSGVLLNYTIITSLGSESSYTATDLQGMRGNLSGNYALGATINASATGGWDFGIGFSPIGSYSGSPYTGAFEGLGHTITNISQEGTNYVGLFGYTGSSARISNVGIVGGSVTGNQNVGSLVGRNEGTIYNAYTTASVTGTSWTGGLVGLNYGSGSISNSYAAGTVNGNKYTGGLVGDNQNSQTGTGVVHITNSYSTATVTGSGTGNTDTGGLVGYNDGVITDTYAAATVTGSSNRGGLVGEQVNNRNGGGIINSSYSFSTWALVGLNTGTINSPSAAVSSTALKTLSTFSGWSIDDTGASGAIWRIYDGDSYPLLRSFLTPATIASVSDAVKTYDATAYSGGNGYSVPGTSGHIYYGGAAQGVRNAGTYGLTIYSDQQGYDLIGPRTANLTINPAGLTLSTLNVTKTYDGGTSALGTVVAVNGTQVFAGDSISGGAFAFTDKNAGSGNKTVTVSGVTVSDGNSGNNYSVTYAPNTASTINPKVLTVTGTTAADKTYDGSTTAAITVGSLSGFVGSETVTATAAGTFNSKNVGSRTATAHYTLVDGSNNGLAINYSLADTTASAAITPYAVTLTAPSVTKTYDGGTSYSTTAGNLGVLSIPLFSGDTVVAATIAYTDKNAGSGNKTVTLNSATINDGNGGNNYSVTYAGNSTSTITPKTVTLSASKTYDGTTSLAGDVTVATGIAGEALTYTGAVATDAHVATTGKYISSISLADGTGGLASNYQLPGTFNATTAPVNITAATLTPTITNTGVTKVYDGGTSAPAGFTPTYSFSGLVSGDTAAALTNTGAAYNSKDVASANKVTVSGLSISSITGSSAVTDYVLDAASKYVTASITPKTVTLSASKTYDGTTSLAGDVTVATGIAGEALTYTGAVATDAHVATTGKYISSISLADGTGGLASNYQLPGTFNATTAPVNITAATLTPTITNTGVTKVYDGGTSAPAGFTPTYSFSGLVSGDTAAALTNTGAAYNSKDVASANKITVSGLSISSITGSSAVTDYVLDAASKYVTASITPKTVTLSASKTYDGTTSLAGDVTVATGIAGEALTYTGAVATDAHVATTGKYISSISLADGTGLASNYQLPGTFNATNAPLTITAATLTPTITNTGVTKTYDGGVSAPSGFTPTYSFSGLVSGDSGATLTNTGAAYNSKDVASANKVTVSGLAISGITGSRSSAATDYVLDAASKYVTASITAKALTAAYTATDKTYDSTTAVTVAGSSTAVVSGDTVTFSQTAAFADKNAGAGKTVNISAISLGGADSGNYSLQSTTATATASITPKGLTVTANDDAKNYSGVPYRGGNDVTYAGFVTGETASVLSGTPAYGGTSQGAVTAGKYSIIPSGLTSGNYTITFVNGQLVITGAPAVPGTTMDTVTGALTSAQNSNNSTQQNQQGRGQGSSGSFFGPGSGSDTVTSYFNNVIYADQTGAGR